jgi:hypothetical protein
MSDAYLVVVLMVGFVATGIALGSERSRQKVAGLSLPWDHSLA